MGWIGRMLLATALAGMAAAPGEARDTLGVFGGWGAFREDRPRHCFAIAEPARRVRGDAAWRPFAAVAHWPGRQVRGQLHIRLRGTKLRGTPVFLTVGERRFRLVAGGADAWAPNARADRAIVAAIRSASGMSVETLNAEGRPLVDVYRLRGAATAIDAAALACSRLR